MKKGVKKIIGGVLIFVVVMILPFALFIPLFLQDDARAFRAPGSIEVHIEEPGRYYLWHDYATIFENQTYYSSKELPHGMTFAFFEKDFNTSLPIHADSNSTHQSGNEKRASIGYFEVTQAGQYILEVTGTTEERIFSFRKALFENILVFIGGIFLATILSIFATLGALVLIVFGIIDLARGSNSAAAPAAQETIRTVEDPP